MARNRAGESPVDRPAGPAELTGDIDPGRDAERAAIVDFWRSIELFSPQTIPKASPRDGVYDVAAGVPAPWEPGHSLAAHELREGYRWRHTVYCGVFDRKAAFDLLHGKLETDGEAFDNPTSGESALAAFTVSSGGSPVPGSEVLSSCAWAIGRAVNPGPGTPGWLTGLEDAQDAFSDLFDSYVAAADGGSSPPAAAAGTDRRRRPLSADDLLQCASQILALLGLDGMLDVSGTRVQSRAVKEAADQTDDQDFLNSFIAGDLSLVAGEVASGNYGAALRSYLSLDGEVDLEGRIDVEERVDVVHDGVSPRSVPPGRWPARPEQPLALSQQFAVAHAVESLADSSGIFAVNGPPGTGKTTMLREVVADVVVSRARALAGLASPRDAFAAKHTWKTGDYTRTVHSFRPELTGFEMVVACATNAAAENISTEIPSVDAIDPDRNGEIDYFPVLATRLLATKRTGATGTAPAAWALIAGCLGSKANRIRFVRALWFNDTRDDELRPRPVRAPSGVNHASDTRASDTRASDTRGGGASGLLEILKSYEKQPPSPAWPDAVAAFSAAFAAVDGMLQERAGAFDLLEERAAAELQVERSRALAASAPAELADARRRHTEAEALAVALADEVRDLRAARREHREFRPNLTEAVFSGGRAMREWRARDREFAHASRGPDAEAAEAAARLRLIREEVGAAERAIGETAAAAAAAERHLLGLDEKLAEASERLGGFLPDEAWWGDRRRRETNAPWTDPTWNAARTQLFLAALRLHKAFVVAVAREIRQSVHGAIDILDGSAPPDLDEAAASAAWQSLFLVVPVVSTTFASFARVFSHLGRESLGWLFIDEAGQSAPQTPAGALWRARRALVIGDPLQLEPVVTLPFTAQQAIRLEHGVDETWLPSRCSAQTLADRVSRIGTFRGVGDDRIWIGAPLNVHRRCDEPIFAIVNELAYDGRMINATAERIELPFPPSKWLDVVSADADGHWIPAEGEKLAVILSYLERMQQDFEEVFVLTPFRRLADHRELAAHRRRYPGITIGTVHTAQGREADVVILVLGGDPSRPGAKRWAASKPNLINVAVSRAKRRLYVIGDRRAWAEHPHFDVLAARLPVG